MSDDNIIGFPPVTSTGNTPDDADEFVLTCPECSCTTFQIKLGGNITCANCDEDVAVHAPQLPWGKITYEGLDRSAVPEVEPSKTLRFQGDLARARVVRRVNEWHKDNTLLMAVVYSENEGSSQWSGVATAEERAWALRKLDEMKDWLMTFELGEMSAEGEPTRDFAKTDKPEENDNA